MTELHDVCAGFGVPFQWQGFIAGAAGCVAIFVAAWVAARKDGETE